MLQRRYDWDVKLDESFLCWKCRKPDQAQDFFLEVTIDGKTTRSRLRDGDLKMLYAFAEGKLVWEESDQHRTMVYPLQPELLRLCELLGVDEDLETLIERIELEDKLKEKRRKP